MKALFVPLAAQHFMAFDSRAKRAEYRLYGPRWNERTCPTGRRVLIAYGYTKLRLRGVVRGFDVTRFGTISAGPLGESLRQCYGAKLTHSTMIAVIGIDVLTPASEGRARWQKLFGTKTPYERIKALFERAVAKKSGVELSAGEARYMARKFLRD
jgi:hypothetical protein